MSYRLLTIALVLVAACSTATDDPTTTASSTSTTAGPAPTTTTTEAPACDETLAIDAIDAALHVARLTPAEGPWSTDSEGSVYADAVVQAEQFASSLGLPCATRLVQGVGAPNERLAVAAWAGERIGFVVLALDQPLTPYDESARFDLLFEQPWGEWVSETVWAVTVSSGDSVIVGSEDYPIGPVAKSFLVEFPEPPPAEPEVLAEEYAIAALEAAGMGNVGIAEPTDTDVASIAFTSTLGNPMIATVGPIGSFDPFTGYLTGERTVEDIGGVEVQVVLAGPDQFGVADVSWLCGEYGWRLESSVGTPDEPVEVARTLIASLECPG